MLRPAALKGEPAPVTVLGDLNLDLVLEVPAIPLPGGDGVASRQRIGFGGAAANTAVVLHRLGVPSRVLSCVGDDDWGASATAALTDTGVQTGLVRRTALDSTSLNVVAVTPDGERTMLAYRGASALLEPADVPDDLSGDLHVSGYALLAEPQRAAAVEAARRAHSLGARISLDIPVDPVTSTPEELREFLPSVDVLVIGADEASALSGEREPAAAGRRLAQRGIALVAVKLGARGALLIEDGAVIEVAALRVDVVDSTGAGDAFCAGLIAALRAGADTETAGIIAAACGAAAVATRGAGVAMPGHAEVVRLLDGERPAEAAAIAVLSRLGSSTTGDS